MTDKITQVVILGGEGSEWIVATALAKKFNGQLNISVLNGSIGNTRDAFFTVQSAQIFHQSLGIDEQEFVKKTRAGIRLGTQYLGWTSSDSRFIHSLSANGFSLDGNEFHHYLQRLHAEGVAITPDDFSLAAQAAQQNRFAHTKHMQSPIFSALSYGYHLSANAYFEYFRHRAINAGVLAISCTIHKAISDSEEKIQHLVLDNGKTIHADLWIDCSGEIDSVLSHNNEFISWENFIPINRALKVVVKKTGHFPLLTHLHHHKNGWRSDIHLEDSTISDFHFLKQELTDAQALELAADMHGDINITQRHIKVLHCGTRDKHWKNNCICIGAAAGYLTELTIPALHLIHSSILRLIELFPTSHQQTVLADEYNRITQHEYAHVRDIHQLHILLAQQNRNEFQINKPLPISDALRHKMQVFKQLGKVPAYEEETCSPGLWASLFLGFNYWPESADVLATAMPLVQVKEKLNRLKETLHMAAQELPAYPHYWDTFSKIESVVARTTTL